MIEINVNGSVVSVQQKEALYCGAQDVYFCRFSFDRSWDKYRKSAVFRAAGKAVTAVIADDGTCLLPWELLVRDSIGLEIEAGVYGVSADGEILTSVWDSIGTVREGSEIGSDAREPSAGVYQQVMATLRDIDGRVSDLLSMTQRVETVGAIASGSAEAAKASETAATSANTEAQAALNGVQSALAELPAGSTLVINNLTTDSSSAALSAGMGKKLEQSKMPVTPVYYPAATNKSADDLLDPFAMIPVSTEVNPELRNILEGTFCYVRTYFYGSVALTSRRMQVAFSYNAVVPKMAVRLYGANGWVAWNEVITSAGGSMANGSKLKFPESGGKTSVLRSSDVGFVIASYLSADDEASNYATFNFKHDGTCSLGIVTETGAATKWGAFLSTLDKPSGSYTGGGSPAIKTIVIGGLGDAVIVYNAYGAGIVTKYGGFMVALQGNTTGAITTYLASEAKYEGGVLTLATDSVWINASGANYVYRVL